MIEESVYKHYFKALVSGDRSRCAETVSQLIEKNTTAQIIYTDLFQKSLYEIGELWEQNRISVAVEHLATAITPICQGFIGKTGSYGSRSQPGRVRPS